MLEFELAFPSCFVSFAFCLLSSVFCFLPSAVSVPGERSEPAKTDTRGGAPGDGTVRMDVVDPKQELQCGCNPNTPTADSERQGCARAALVQALGDMQVT